MSSQRWISVAAALVAWVCIGAGVAHAGVISKVGGGGTVTLSVFQKNADGTFTDITDTYPIGATTWTPTATAEQRTVYVVVNGSEGAPSLVTTDPIATGPNPYLTDRTTSRFAGNCTNFGTDTGLDFDLNTTSGTVSIPVGGGVTKTGYPLVSNDCGGMAVIKVGTTSSDKYIVPKDANGAGSTPNGIPDALETFGVALAPETDTDGDGFSTFDETVRGFIVSEVVSGATVRKHLRLNPTVKNLFVYLVKGQCGTSRLTGSGAFPIAGADALDANLNTLIPPPSSPPLGIAGTQIHFLGASLSSSVSDIRTDEWVDHFVSFTLGSDGTTETWTYCSSALSPTGSCTSPATTVVITPASDTPAAPTTDRVVTKNRVYGSADQKGLRVTECATTSGTTPHGTGRYGSAAQGKDEAVVYTDRIRRYVNGLGQSKSDIYYSTFRITDSASGTGAWTTLQKKGGGTTTSTQAARNFITSKAIEYILAMEIGHTLKLVSDTLLTVTFPHYAAGYGDNMDEALRAETSGTPAGVKYYIPTIFLGDSQGLFQLTGP